MALFLDAVGSRLDSGKSLYMHFPTPEAVVSRFTGYSLWKVERWDSARGVTSHFLLAARKTRTIEVKNGISYNAIMRYKAVIDAMRDFIQKRAARANRQKFENALAKVPYGESSYLDRLPAFTRKEKSRVLKKK